MGIVRLGGLIRYKIRKSCALDVFFSFVSVGGIVCFYSPFAMNSPGYALVIVLYSILFALVQNGYDCLMFMI